MAITTGTNGNNTINGTGTADRIFGLGGNDKLNGLGGNDTLDGGAGNDTLDGGAGNDRVIGGTGNDTYIVTATSGTDTFVEAGAGGGTDTVRSSRTSFTLGAHIENLVLTGSGNISGTGNTERNKLTGNTGNNKLFGKDGIDTLEGGAGNDTLDGGAANDRLVGGTGNDVYIVGSAAATGTDTIVEAAGAGGGTDTVRSSRTYTLGANIEKLVLTGSGNLNGFGNGSNNQITGNTGKNRLSGLDGNDILDGGSGNDTLTGGADNDSLAGGLGNDSLIGGAGNDTLHGGGGTDKLLGGAGDDTYIVDDELDQITEESGIDTVATTLEGYTLDNLQIENLTLLGSGNSDGTGNANANVLTGNSGANQLDGADGMDTLDGGAGADSLFGGTGASSDVLIWDMDDEVRDGGDGTDTLLVKSGTAADLEDANITAIEKIELAGTASVSLTSADIGGHFSGSVTIDGGAGASVNAGGGWTLETIEDGYAHYFHDGDIMLVVDVDIDRDGIGVPDADALSLDGTNGFTISGTAGNVGRSVAAAGDVNGDGYDDFIVGAPNTYDGLGKGAAYVVFGHAGSFESTLDPAALNGTNGFAILGSAESGHAGMAVSAAGDVNGDGLTDLIIGAPYSGNDGEAFVVFGSSAFGSTFNVSDLNGTNGFRIAGDDDNDRTGISVSAADLNGDGLTDLIVGDDYTDGGYGATYVIFGTATFSSSMDVSSVDGNNGFRIFGQDENDDFGFSVSRAGDVNGDGIEDLIVGARYSDYGDNEAGSSYVVFGNAGGFDAELDLDNLESNGAGFAIHGYDSYEHSGHSVAAAGDVNGDGLADLIIGAPVYSEEGAAYVVFGSNDPEDLDLDQLNGTNGFVIIGAEYAEGFGTSVSSAGDFNGDGYDDLIIGVHHDDSDADPATYVVFGASSFEGPFILGEIDGLNGFRLTGIPANEVQSVSGGRDLNGDGFADLIVGQGEYNDAYVIFGHDTGHVTHQGTAGPNTLTGTAGADVIVAGAGNDTLIGGGGNDVFHAGAGDDRIVLGAGDPLRVDGGAGTDTVALDGFGGGILLDGIQTSNVRGIEIADLSGTRANTLVVTKAGVLNLSDITNTLTVTGNASDAVTLVGDWELADTDGGFEEWVNGNARVHVAEALTVNTDSISLGALNGSNGFTFFGEATSRSGISVAGAGDVDGDGLGDVIIGAWTADAAGGNNSGAAYVVYGDTITAGSALDLSALTGAGGFRIEGYEPGDVNGYSVAGLGDFDGDGYADVISGAFGANPGGTTDAGQPYVVFGGVALASSFQALDLNGITGFRLDGVTAEDYSGVSVASAGDFNGDGYIDVLVGANKADGTAGQAFLVFGAPEGAQYNASLSSFARFDGPDAGSFTGRSVASAGDFNGDGFDDIVIGNGQVPSGASGAEECYVVFGTSDFTLETDLSALDGTNGFRVDGVAGQFGWAVASAGDFNGDGFSDIIVGAHNLYGVAGASYVIYGKDGSHDPVLDLSGGLAGADGLLIRGVAPGDRSGFSVASAGDFNGDGYDDVIIGAWSTGVDDAGTSYIVYGAAEGFESGLFNLSALDATSGLRLDGFAANDNAGRSVASAGDVNGDGYDDVIIGAVSATDADDAGTSYVVYGGNRNGAVDFAGGTGNDTQSGTAAGETFVGGRGNDLMVGGGGADAFHGGGGNDRIVLGAGDFLRVDGGAGEDTLAADALGASIVLGDYGSIVFDGIERIDLSGTRANTVLLGVAEVAGLSDTSNRVYIDGNAGDAVSLTGQWFLTGSAAGYDHWISGAAEVYVEQGLAVYASSLSLGALNGANGFTFLGSDSSKVGQSVAAAGDVDGDGLGDLIIGATGAYDSYVVYGDTLATGSALALHTITGGQGFRIEGYATNGYSVASTGDINGDGYADIISGEFAAPTAAGSQAGQAYVVFGASTLASAFSGPDLNGSNGFRLDGAVAGGFAGAWVSSAGDVNADGYDDILVGANNANTGTGATYLVYGMAGGFASAMALSDAGIARFDGRSTGDYSGRSVAEAGDFNGDGYGDIIIGVGYVDECYVVFGDGDPLPADLDLSSLDGTNGFRIDGPGGDAFGRTVASAGDFNGDGLADLIIGANNLAGDNGSAYVVYGTTDAQDPVFDLSSGISIDDGVRFTGNSSERLGASVASAGDFNGDGYDDVIIGAPTSNAGAFDSGVVYIVYGTAGGFGVTDFNMFSLDPSTGFRLTGVGEDDKVGHSVASAGDINGDGYDDVIVGAPLADGYDGSAYVVYGGNSNGAVDFAGGTGNDTLTGTGAAEAFVGGRGNDVLVGGGGADAFHGGAGNDVITIGDSSFLRVDGGAGFDTLRLGALDFDLSFSGAGDTRVSGIEAVDMRGNGDADFELSLADLLDLSNTSNVLTIEGDAGDEVFMLTTDGWTDQSTAGGYHTWTHGAATLKVDENVAVYFET